MLSHPHPGFGRSRARRTAGALAVPVLALALALAGCGDASDGESQQGATDGGSPTESVPGSPRADAAADWLLGQREEGVLVGEYGADYGLTIDTALSLEGMARAGLPAYDDAVAEIAETMTQHVASYTTGVDFGSSDVYAGAVAKTAVLAQAAGMEATDFGGVDLIDRLEQRVADATPSTGRLGDEVTDPQGTDYANVIGQAYAVRALSAAGSDEAGAATSYLLAQQCEAGYFRLYFAAPDAAEQSCDAGDAEASAADPDVTALAVLSLDAQQEDDPDVAAAVDDAVAWLLSEQLEDGSFGGGTSTQAPNANSTGLAGWALGGQDEEDAARGAADWLAARQITDQACDVPGLAGETGAVAYDDAALSGAETAKKGLGTARDQWRSATVQALPALAWATQDEGGDGAEGWRDC